jgi:CheY-like chemotaxis protein
LRSGAGSRPPTAGVEKKLGELTPARRQALLLTAMEGFNVSDTARILEVGEEQVKQMVAQAVREISDQPSTKVLIIEDEPIISLDLQSIVREMGHTVAAIATTRDEAVRAARKTEPGLVLADIKLADGSSGIDAVRQILSEVQVPIVFITAYPERLLTGERPEPTFLVTKPFVPETVRVAVSQALLFTKQWLSTQNHAGPRMGPRLHSVRRRQREAAQTGGRPRNAPATSATSVSTRKMKNRILAIPAAAPAMVVKPSTAAMIATMKNVKAQDSIKKTSVARSQ